MTSQPLELQWSLDETVDSSLAIARGVIRAATHDNVQAKLHSPSRLNPWDKGDVFIQRLGSRYSFPPRGSAQTYKVPRLRGGSVMRFPASTSGRFRRRMTTAGMCRSLILSNNYVEGDVPYYSY